MRPQPDLPPRRRKQRSRREGSRFEGRGRLLLGLVLGGLFVLLVSLRGIASVYTEYLWFGSLDLTSVWTTVLRARVSLILIGAGTFFALCWVNLVVADRMAPPFRPAIGDDDLIERYHEIVGEHAGKIRLGVAALLAVMVGAGLGSSWTEWVLFTNRVDFGETDATFNTDLGFYVFQLPFLTSIGSWLFSSLVLVLIVTVLAHLLNGGIRFHENLDRVTPQVKAHVSVLLGALALVQGGRYWLDRYQLTFSTRGTVDGATYTDVNVQLRVIYLLIAIALFAFVLFIANIRRRGWVLPLMAVGLWAFVGVLAGTIVPTFVQRFRVEPAESRMEAQYIEQNIKATRAAYDLGDVEEQGFDFTGDLDTDKLIDNVDVVANVRLWDPEITRESYVIQQQIRSFYEISDVDVDRYVLDGELTQVMLAARNLNTSGVQQGSWEARHLAYTHGHGVVVSRANTKTSSGGPDLLARDIPARIGGGLPESDQLALYFGEGLSGYVIVDTDRAEIDYQDEDNNTQTTTYDGADGIRIGSGLGGYLRRAAFSLRFGDINPLISGNVQSDSRVLVERDVRSRAEALAPFLAYDHDPHLVLTEDGAKYILDGYTTTRNFPNAERADTGGLDQDSGLRGRSFNYARNSVKVVVDAYDGTVDFYVVDTEDPIIQAWRKAFPDLFSDLEDAPDGLEDHFRYPEDLFMVQSQMWARYHVGDADTFYNGNDAWTVPQEPGVVPIGEEAAPAVGPDGQRLTSSDRFEPQYLLSRLPGEEETSFILMRPFVPVGGQAGASQRMTSIMVANSDPGRYGELQTWVMPSGRLPFGPRQVADEMTSAPGMRREQTLLCAQGTRCDLRNMVVVPIDDSILYVRSLFVRGDETGLPRLERVIVSYQTPDETNRIVVAGSLRAALVTLFDDEVPEQIEDVIVSGSTEATIDEVAPGEGPVEGDENGEDDPPPATTTTVISGSDDPMTQDEDELIGLIVAAFDEADRLAREGDRVGEAEKLTEAAEYARRLQELRSGAGGGSDSDGEGDDEDSAPTTSPDTTTTTTAGA